MLLSFLGLAPEKCPLKTSHLNSHHSSGAELLMVPEEGVRLAEGL